MIYETETASLRGKKGKADGVKFRKPGYVAAAAKPKSAQAVVKVISQARGHRAKILMNYVARSESEKPLVMEDENGLQVQGVDGIEAAYEKWRQDFERAIPGQKLPPRHVTHMIFSGACKQTPENARAVQSAIAELMQDQLGRDGYRYLMVLHTDTPNPHVHVVVNNYNRDKDGPKLRLNPPELLALRQQFALKLRERGIEQQATLRKDRPAVLEAVAKGIEDLQAGGAWFERKLLKAAELNPMGPSPAEATPAMLKWANELAAKNGVPLESTNFETVRKFLDTHSPKRLGLDAAGGENASITEKPAAFDAFAKRRAMVRAVARIKADVKASTLPFTQERRERMALLRKIDQQLIDPAAPDYQRLVQNLTLKIGKDRERIQDHIRALSDPSNPVKDNKRRRQRERAIDQIIARNIEGVRSARLDLLRAPGVGVIEAYKLGYQLKAYERELMRIGTLHAFGAEQKAAPGTTAEVAQARTVAAAVARAARTADKLERLGPWHEPNPGARPGQAFDAFAKRQALTNIATHLADTLDRAGVPASDPLTARVVSLRRSLIEAPAPDSKRLVDALQQRLQDARQRADFDVRRAAHASTPAPERTAIVERVRADMAARVASLTAARREIAELPNLGDRERQALIASLKRMALITKQAGQLVDKPAAFAGKLAELDKLRGTPQHAIAKSLQPARSVNNGQPDLDVTYGLKATPSIEWQGAELYPDPYRTEPPPLTLDSLRTMSGLDLDGRAASSEVLLPDNAHRLVVDERATRVDGVRRPDHGIDAAGGSTAEGGREGGRESQRVAPLAAPGDRLTQAQLGALLDRVHTRLVEAGAWDDATPYRSGVDAFYKGDDGQQRAPVLDAFAKRRTMVQDIDKLTPIIDAAEHVNFTPEMRKRLAAIRDLREGIQNAPAKDIEGAVNRLAEKITNDQLRIERQRDKPATSATEALQRRRGAERTASQNLQSIDAASREIQKSPSAQPMQRIALAARLKQMTKAMELYSGKGMGR